MKWEPGFRIKELPTKWTARVRNKDTGEPRRCNVRDFKLKDPAEDWNLKAESIGRAAKFVNYPTNLPDNSNPLDKNQTKPDGDKVKKYGLRKNINTPKRLDL